MVAVMNPMIPLASGRDADVFELDEDRVLRRYRAGGDVSTEAAVMTYVGELGFPVPRVHRAEGADLVLDRLSGPTLLQALGADEISPAAAADLLADLHTRLHELPPRIGPDPELRVLHLDLHPGNVMLTASGPVVIDWRNTAEGPPDLDLAVSALILALVGLDDGYEFAAAARIMLGAFLARAGGDPLRTLDHAVALRTVDPALTAAEVDRLASAAALVRVAG
jgi:aminoglycoside phosphotransferase (APT) family kinase protein